MKANELGPWGLWSQGGTTTAAPREIPWPITTRGNEHYITEARDCADGNAPQQDEPQRPLKPVSANIRKRYDTETEEWRETIRKDPCALCGGPGGSIDHIVPRSAGGPNRWDNLSGCYRDCNTAVARSRETRSRYTT